CVDAIVIAGQMIGSLQTLVSRNVAPGDPAVLSLCSIHGGSAHNVICDEVVLRGTLRTVDPATRERMKERIVTVAEGTAALMGGSAAVEFLPGYCALRNHAAQVDRVAQTARLLFGPDAFVAPEGPPGMGVEDFAYFLEQAPGAYFGLGAQPEGPAFPGHHPRYLPDERALPYGAALFAALALSEMGLLEDAE
nr:peptidase dimerization domain-containing protein [Clostridia bacterium]